MNPLCNINQYSMTGDLGIEDSHMIQDSKKARKDNIHKAGVPDTKRNNFDLILMEAKVR